MSTFVHAVLERNDPGAQYEGIVYDRVLTIRHSSGRVLEVFDMSAPLASGLEPGRAYDLLIAATLPRDLRVDGSASARWHGKVIDVSWTAPEAPLIREGIADRRWVLVETEIGAVLMSPLDLPAEAAAGTRLSWEDARFDLYGVLDAEGTLR
jgi:hypothetical protein